MGQNKYNIEQYIKLTGINDKGIVLFLRKEYKMDDKKSKQDWDNIYSNIKNN